MGLAFWRSNCKSICHSRRHWIITANQYVIAFTWMSKCTVNHQPTKKYEDYPCVDRRFTKPNIPLTYTVPYCKQNKWAYGMAWYLHAIDSMDSLWMEWSAHTSTRPGKTERPSLRFSSLRSLRWYDGTMAFHCSEPKKAHILSNWYTAMNLCQKANNDKHSNIIVVLIKFVLF